MANAKITALTELATTPAVGDFVPIVDVSDTTDAATGTTKKISAANLLKTAIVVACSDESTVIVAANGVLTFRMPYAMTLTAVRASLKTAAGLGTFTVDINESGSTILSTPLTIDATEKTSTTAVTPAVISDPNLADDAEIRIDVDDDASGDAVGLKVALIGTRA